MTNRPAARPPLAPRPTIRRDAALDELLGSLGDGQVKVVTGIRRCGKTYLVFRLLRERLREMGVDDDRIIEVRLDEPDYRRLRDPERLYRHVLDRARGDTITYVLIDEVQQAITPKEFRALNVSRPLVFDVLNAFLNRGDLEVVVTGSNSRFLSSDIMTEFRGRGTEVRLHPLSFAEFAQTRDASPRDLLTEYLRYGGMPDAVLNPDEGRRRRYLRTLFEGTYQKDIVQRYGIKKPAEMDGLAAFLASNVGSPTSAAALAKNLSRAGSAMSETTVIEYLHHLSESFVVDAVAQTELRGKEILQPEKKYYFEDLGLRNALLGFPRLDLGHLLENALYNELQSRSFEVGVGRVSVRESDGTRRVWRRYECDFVAEGLGARAYVQSCWSLEGEGVYEREMRPLLALRDSYPKLLVVADQEGRSVEPGGIVVWGAIDFLLDRNSLRL